MDQEKCMPWRQEARQSPSQLQAGGTGSASTTTKRFEREDKLWLKTNTLFFAVQKQFETSLTFIYFTRHCSGCCCAQLLQVSSGCDRGCHGDW
jgi:hypothetical protein